MGRCSAITQSGTRCRQRIILDDGLCAAHSPRRREAAPAPGRSRGTPAPDSQAAPSVAAGYRRRLEEIAEGVLDPEGYGVKSASAAIAGYNACLRALKVEAELREIGELEERIKRLEEARKWAG